MSERNWIDASAKPEPLCAVLVRIEGHRREFVAFVSKAGEWFIHNASKQGVRFPCKITHWCSP